MARIVEQSPIFKRCYKKLHKNQIKAVNEAIRAIQANPDIGERKKGDLAGVLVYKFRLLDQEMLLAYEYDDTSILLMTLGAHENFYRNLKRKQARIKTSL